MVAEIGDITRFENPRQLMAWLGLVPSEHSSGGTSRRGRLTKTGNALARTMLVEASWSYRHPPKEGQPYLKRSAHLPQEIKDIGWKAQTRLCSTLEMAAMDREILAPRWETHPFLERGTPVSNLVRR